MALEAVVFPQEHLSCAATYNAAPSLGCGVVDMDEFEENGGVVLQEEAAAAAMHGGAGGGTSAWVNAATCARSIASGAAVEEFWDERHFPVSPPALSRTAASPAPTPAASGGGHAKAAARRRRRRPKVVKNKEEAESQRRNHIAVERNRRRQMNEYLAVLRSLMPPSYAQRGDQASIVAGAINFVKELEQLLQSLEAQKRRALGPDHDRPPPFAGFFTFPQYSTTAAGDDNVGGSGADGEGGCGGARPGAADIEVAMAESHANVRVLAPRRPRQLLRMVVALQCLGLTVLHLNVTTTADRLALYSFSLKMEGECRLSSVDEIAAAVNQMVAKIAGECIS
ncbi:transcription factor bHLH94-like [Oryza brachyantha]|uniref:transcription factor bHLH94-like n=1 Tax=Oryza brachyantha TaxID=4533 RepID=UPI001ADB3A1C|nr:transcription factor bHLH94-like [Oryza brachyantha]